MRRVARSDPEWSSVSGTGPLLALGCAAALATTACSTSAPVAPLRAPAAVVEIRSANVRLAALRPPWVRLDPAAFEPEDLAVFMRTEPEVFFSVAAESVGMGAAGTTEALVEVARGRVASRSSFSVTLESGPHPLHGLPGRRLAMGSLQGARRVHTVIWALVLNGFRYQLTVWGAEPRATRRQVEDVSDGAFAAFDVLDRARVSRAGASDPTAPFRSPRYGYVVNAPGDDWHVWAGARQAVTGVEYGLALGERGSLVVLPIRLFGTDPDLEALAAGLADRLDIDLEDDGLSPCQPFEAGPMRGCDYRLSRGEASNPTAFRIRVAKGGNAAFLVAAWVERGASPDPSGEAARALAAVDLGGAGLRQGGELSSPERRAHGEVFNQIGLWLHDRGKYDEAVRHFRLAFELEATDPVLLGNVVEAYAAAGRYVEGLLYLDRHIAGFPEDADLERWRETLVEELGAQARSETWS
jgi:hypothetical protein